jgi:Ser/Thr protein kinase RdoA (MazF antagonist)
MHNYFSWLPVHPTKRWMRQEPRRHLEPELLDAVIHKVFGSRGVSAVSPLTDGFRNANFKVDLTGSPESVVLRLYEHDPAICRKEADLLRLVAVPEIIHAEPNGMDGLRPFMLMTFVEGISLRDLRHTSGNEPLAQAGYSVGRTLAAIGRFSFERPGWLSHGPTVTAPLLEGTDPVPRFIEQCLGDVNFQRRVPRELGERVRNLVWRWAPQLAELDTHAQLVHCDLGHRNLLVLCVDGSWQVTAVLDWEFAISGSPLADIGHFLLRHERQSMDVIEPHFISGYLDGGGSLPQDWRHLAGLLDLTALCESLTHVQLPETIIRELVDLVQNTAVSVS